MRATLKAIQAHMADQFGDKIAVRRDEARDVTAPYVILSASIQPTHEDEALSGPEVGESGGELVVTCVAATADGVRAVAAQVRGVLSPGLRAARITTATRAIETVWDGSLGMAVDRDITLPATDTHPWVGHESYGFSSLPLTPDPDDS